MIMALIQTLVTLLILPSFLGSFVLGYTSKEVKEWCSQTPFPQPCEYFLNNNPSQLSLKKKSDFLELSMQLALKRGLLAQKNAYTLGKKCRSELEKKAWTDCLELYEYTIEKLTKTSGTKCSQVDTQTWLSTALTDLETCKQGFYELGVPDNVLPLMSNNVSSLISNCLSINHNTSLYNPNPSYKKDGFPHWVNPSNRKLLQSSSPASSANLVVAQDGSGNFMTVGAAIAAAKNGYVIYIKTGVYSENVDIKLADIKLIGDGIGKTIITGSRSVGGGSTTFKSATVAVVGDGFVARDITFRNTAGAKNHQAVALRSGSDLSVFYKCSFEGYQDTLYVHSERQFYRECDIYGTVDFIFGNAAVVLQNCNIRPRDPPNKTNAITAQGRTDPNQNTGISILNSQVTAASDLKPVQGSVKTYLGRPWKQYSRTVFMQTFLDGFIQPAGWMEWSGNFALNTLYYGEYENTGAGAATTNRVTWNGYHVITSATEASKFTVSNFIAGNSWLPATNIPFTAGL